MLQKLIIQNYILIKNIEIDFNKGFNVITGETGAGKSIFVDAIALLLGERLDNSIFSDEAKKCIIEGHFNIEGLHIKSFFEEKDIDYQDVCIIRREIIPQGKSRIFVNDTPVNLNTLKQLGSYLIDIHSQHSTLLLAKPSFQIDLVDAIANIEDKTREYSSLFLKWKKLFNEIKTLKDEIESGLKENDYYNFLLNEIKELKTYSGESSELEEEYNMLKNVEKIKYNLFEASQILSNADNNIIQLTKETSNKLKQIEHIFGKIKPLIERLDTTIIELNDIAYELDNIQNNVTFEENRFNFIEERLNALYKLFHKHRVKNSDELLDIEKNLENKVKSLDEKKILLEEKEKNIRELYETLQQQADILSEHRKSVLPEIENEIIATLRELGMPNARFNIRVNQRNELNEKGKDEIVFLFSANLSEEPQEISRVASGGEMSRLMLALKSIMAKNTNLPTIIFDEIDTGVSGEIAKKVSNIFRSMGQNVQLIVITHQPQIAAKADYHYYISKKDVDNDTLTTIKLLNNEERIIELAKMISGINYTKDSIETAKQLMKY